MVWQERWEERPPAPAGSRSLVAVVTFPVIDEE
jgi:hypothetical protein